MRAKGWEIRLRELVEGASSKPFEWGSHDCALFALAAFEAVTGAPVPRVDTWKDATSAARLLRDKPIRKFGREWFGEPVKGWKMARRGDIVLIGSNRSFMGQPAFAVCVGATVACPGEKGLQFEALRHSFLTWNIG